MTETPAGPLVLIAGCLATGQMHSESWCDWIITKLNSVVWRTVSLQSPSQIIENPVWIGMQKNRAALALGFLFQSFFLPRLPSDSYTGRNSQCLTRMTTQ